jgi:hypothetical protein
MEEIEKKNKILQAKQANTDDINDLKNSSEDSKKDDMFKDEMDLILDDYKR